MKVHLLEREQRLSLPPHKAFAFFSDAFNLEAITPPWLGFRVMGAAPIELRPGTVIEYRLRLRGVPIRWLTRIEAWDPGRRFVDRQVEGPFRLWHHTHTFEPAGEGSEGTVMRDLVRYAPPLGPLGALAHRAFIRRDLERIFDFRQQETARLLAGP